VQQCGKNHAKIVSLPSQPAHPSQTNLRCPQTRKRTHHVRQVRSPVQGRIRLDVLAPTERLAVDGRRDRGQLGDQVEGVLQDRLPVLGLGQPRLVRLCKHALRLQREDRGRELRHRVRAGRQRLDHGRDVVGEGGAAAELGGHRVGLRLCGDLWCGRVGWHRGLDRGLGGLGVTGGD